jgi:aldose 1-epimerase
MIVFGTVLKRLMNRTIRIVPRVKMFSFQKRHAVFISLCLLCAGILLAQSQKGPNVEKQSFGTAPDGQSIDIYTLKNSKGMEARITNFGATLVSLRVPDRAGKFDDVVLGFDSLDGYAKLSTFFGATIGRYGNRIAHGQFVLDGNTYTLPKNNGENTLHGGITGFNKHVWTAKPVTTKAGEELELTYVSKDGEEGFPGNLSVKVIYKLAADKNDLTIDYSATTDKDTVLNLTNHSYFNLAGAGSGDILKDVLTIHASKFTPVDAGLIPTGELKDVTGTPFDFRKPTAVGARIDQNVAVRQGLRFELGARSQGGFDGDDRGSRSVRANDGARARSFHHRARGAVLLRKPHGRHAGEGRQDVPLPRRALPGNAALSRFAESSFVSDHRTETRRNYDRIEILCSLAGANEKSRCSRHGGGSGVGCGRSVPRAPFRRCATFTRRRERPRRFNRVPRRNAAHGLEQLGRLRPHDH